MNGDVLEQVFPYSIARACFGDFGRKQAQLAAKQRSKVQSAGQEEEVA